MATKSILIVDDAAETRIFLKGVAASLGYTTFEAKSGLDALKILNEQSVNLVILDILMPNFDGYQTLEFINKLKPTKNIKVIFLSGKKGELDQAKIDELKPDDFIHKTVEIHVLKMKLKKLMESEAPPTRMTTSQPQQAVQPPVQTPQPAQAPHPQQAHAAHPPQTSTAPQAAAQEQKLELNATITNMPIVLEIKITRVTQAGITFKAKFQFKDGSLLTINCPKAAAALKKTGEFQAKVQRCLPDGDHFVVNAVLA